MDLRPIRQCLRDINLRALGKFSCLALTLSLESTSHPTTTTTALAVSQGTTSPPFAAPLGLNNNLRAPVELWEVGFSGAASMRDQPRWVF